MTRIAGYGVDVGLGVPSDETVDWLDDIQPRLVNLQDVQLPGDFPFDYTVESLDPLESALLSRGGLLDREDPFVIGLQAYLGETLMRVGGGQWAVDLDPAVRFDPALGLPALTPMDLLDRALERRTGHEFERAVAEVLRAVAARQARDPGFEPTKAVSVDVIPTPAFTDIEAWSREQEQRFDAWAAGLDEPGGWDFSPASLDRLEMILRASLASADDAATPEERAVADVASWYFGEVLIRTKGGVWAYIPGDPDTDTVLTGRHFVEAPAGNTAVPEQIVQLLFRGQPPGLLAWCQASWQF